MSFGSGSLYVLSLIQRIAPLPFVVFLKTKQVYENPFYTKQLHHAIRTFCEIFAQLVLLPSCCFRLIWLFFHWKSFTKYNIEEAILYGLATFGTLIYVPVFIMFRTQNCIVNINLFKTYFQLEKTCKLNIGNINRFQTPIIGKRATKELLVYVITTPLLLGLPSLFFVPFTMSHLPIQLIFGNSFPVKVTSGIITGLVGFFMCLRIFSAILIAIYYLEFIIGYTATTHNFSNHGNTKNYSQRFTFFYKRFKISQLVVWLGGDSYTLFLKTLVFFGILAGTCASYATVRMYGKLNLFGYMFGPAVSFCCFVFALLLTCFAGILYTHCKKFKNYWGWQIQKKEDRKRLRSCKIFGFMLGPYGIAYAKLGLRICDDIIQNTVTILLLDK